MAADSWRQSKPAWFLPPWRGSVEPAAVRFASDVRTAAEIVARQQTRQSPAEPCAETTTRAA